MPDQSGETSIGRATERAAIWTARLLAQLVTAIVLITEVVLVLGFLL